MPDPTGVLVDRPVTQIFGTSVSKATALAPGHPTRGAHRRRDVRAMNFGIRPHDHGPLPPAATHV